MENYTSGTATEKSPEAQKKSSAGFSRILKGCECFSLTLLQLSQRPAESKKKTSLFFVFLHQHSVFVRTSVSRDGLNSLCSLLQFVHLLSQTGLSVVYFLLWFYSDYKNICVPTGGCIFIHVRASGAASRSNHSFKHILEIHMSGKPETQVPSGHLNLLQCPVGVVVRFSKAVALDSRDTD